MGYSTNAARKHETTKDHREIKNGRTRKFKNRERGEEEEVEKLPERKEVIEDAKVADGNDVRGEDSGPRRASDEAQ